MVWEDKDFDRARSVRFSPCASDVIWERTDNIPLVARDVKYNDVEQGREGDCFIIVTLAMLALQGRDKLLDVISEDKPSEITVKLFRGGSKIDVKVDCFVPKVSTTRTNKEGESTTVINSLYTDCRHNKQSCFALIEKAFAKTYNSSYKALDGGSIAEAMYDLTGCVVEEVYLDKQGSPFTSKEGASALKALVLQHFKDGVMIGCGHIDTQVKDEEVLTRVALGLRRNHAYAVVGATDKLVDVYNPMGHDDDYDGPTNGGCGSDGQGTYTMTWKSFLKAFNRLTLGFLSSLTRLPHTQTWTRELTPHLSPWLEWDSASGTSGGCTNFPSFRLNPMLVLPAVLLEAIVAKDDVNNSTYDLEVVVGQRDQRSMVAKKKEEAKLKAEAEEAQLKAQAEEKSTTPNSKPKPKPKPKLKPKLKPEMAKSLGVTSAPKARKPRTPSVTKVAAKGAKTRMNAKSPQNKTVLDKRGKKSSSSSSSSSSPKKEKGMSLDYPQLGITVISFTRGGAPMATPENIKVVAKTSAFLNKRDIGLQINLTSCMAAAAKSAKDLAIVPSTFYPDQDSTFWMTLRSLHPELTSPDTDVPTPYWCCLHRDLVVGTWEGPSDGNKTWLRAKASQKAQGGKKDKKDEEKTLATLTSTLHPENSELMVFVQQRGSSAKHVPIGVYVLLVPPKSRKGEGSTALWTPADGAKLVKGTEISAKCTLPANTPLDHVVVVPVTAKERDVVKFVVSLAVSKKCFQEDCAKVELVASKVKNPADVLGGKQTEDGGGKKGKQKKSSQAKGPGRAGMMRKAHNNMAGLGDMYANLI